MQTYQEQLDFFNQHWPAMQQAIETEGAAGVTSLISGFDDDLERRVLYMFANQGLVNQDWKGKNLESYIAVVDAGIAEFLRQAAAAADDETRLKRIDGANILSYNLSADLADCWPGDQTVRTVGQFKRGVQAAEDCINWRKQLDKPPAPFSMAWWAKGMHEISLGRFEMAVTSLTTSLAYAKEDARLNGQPAGVAADGTFSVLLGSGYVGLARILAGDDLGQAQYTEAIDAFKAQLEDESKKGDAQFGIDQLETVRQRYVK